MKTGTLLMTLLVLGGTGLLVTVLGSAAVWEGQPEETGEKTAPATKTSTFHVTGMT